MVFYVDVIDHLCFANSPDRPIDDSLVRKILNVVTSSLIQHPSNDQASFKIEPIYRSILIQIVFKNTK